MYISLTATKRLIETRPRVAERFLAAMMEAEAYARVNREFTIQVMSDYLKLTNRQALEGAYEAYAGDQLAIPPYVPSDGVQAVIDETLRANATAVVREAALLVDNRPLQAVTRLRWTIKPKGPPRTGPVEPGAVLTDVAPDAIRLLIPFPVDPSE